MITPEQQREIEGRESRSLRIFSGDVYARQPDGSVVAIDPDGRISRSEWPAKGVTLNEAKASDDAIPAGLQAIPRKQIQSIGRHAGSFYDPVTGRRRACEQTRKVA